MTRHFTARQSGFTMVELVMTMTLIGILTVTVGMFVFNWLQTATKAQARAELLANAKSALDTVTQDIQLSGSTDQVNRWPDTNSPSGQFGWQSGSQILVLAKAATDKSNNIIFSDPSRYISQKNNQVYYLSNGTLYRRTIKSNSTNDAAVTSCPPASASAGCPADRAIATKVSSFAVSYYDADDNAVGPANARSVQLALTLTNGRSGPGAVSANYSTRMVFRNE